MPRTHDEYRAHTQKYARIFLENVLVNTAKTTDHGFRYSDDDREELQSLIQQILDVHSKGTTLFDASLQSAALVAEQSTIAQADGGFQQMMRSLVPAN